MQIPEVRKQCADKIRADWQQLGVPVTPDPNTSAKLRDTNGSRIVIQIGENTTSSQEEGIPLQKHHGRNRRCIEIVQSLFKSSGVRGRFDSPLNNSVVPRLLVGKRS